MVEVKMSITWKDLYFLLIKELKQYLNILGMGLVSLFKKGYLWLRYQVSFLIYFNYTRENIKQHLLRKAAEFFDFDLGEDRTRRKRSKPYRKKNRQSGKERIQKVRAEKKRSRVKVSPFRSGFKKKNVKNIFVPLE